MAKTSFKYIVNPNDFSNAGKVSQKLKTELKNLNINSEIIRKVTMAVYEGEINMIIHSNGGVINVDVDDKNVTTVLEDNGPGIADVKQAMKQGFSTINDEKIRSQGFGAGMGFANMKKYSDYIDVHSKIGLGTTITMRTVIKK